MIRVDLALTDDDMDWLNRHLELIGEYAYQSAMDGPYVMTDGSVMSYANIQTLTARYAQLTRCPNLTHDRP